MNEQERDIIADIFRRLESAANQPRDPEAERFIAEMIRRQPYAPYAMAQALFVQEQALTNLHAQNQELQAELERLSSRQGSGGGLLSSIFGGGSRPEPAPYRGGSSYGGAPSGGPWGQAGTSVPQAGGGYGGQPGYGAPQGGAFGGGPFGGGRGGGFLQTAMGTAAGVAGGMLIGNALASAFGGDGGHETGGGLGALASGEGSSEGGGTGGITDSLYQNASGNDEGGFGDFGCDAGDDGDWT